MRYCKSQYRIFAQRGCISWLNCPPSPLSKHWNRDIINRNCCHKRYDSFPIIHPGEINRTMFDDHLLQYHAYCHASSHSHATQCKHLPRMQHVRSCITSKAILHFINNSPFLIMDAVIPQSVSLSFISQIKCLLEPCICEWSRPFFTSLTLTKHANYA